MRGIIENYCALLTDEEQLEQSIKKENISQIRSLLKNVEINLNVFIDAENVSVLLNKKSYTGHAANILLKACNTKELYVYEESDPRVCEIIVARDFVMRHLACARKYGHIKTVQVLLDMKGDISIEDKLRIIFDLSLQSGSHSLPIGLLMVYNNNWQIKLGISDKLYIKVNYQCYNDDQDMRAIIGCWELYYRLTYEGMLIMPEDLTLVQNFTDKHFLPFPEMFLAKAKIATSVVSISMSDQISDIEKQELTKQIMRRQYYVDLYHYICEENKIIPNFNRFVERLQADPIFNFPVKLAPITEQKWQSFLLGTHKRLGCHSCIKILPQDVLRLICNQLNKTQPLQERDAHIKARFNRDAMVAVTQLARELGGDGIINAK